MKTEAVTRISKAPSITIHYSGYWIIDNLFGVSKRAKEAANKVILEMDDELRELAIEAGREEANRKANEIKETILNSVSKIVENTAKIAKDTAEKVVKNVAPEVANLLKPEVNIQVEKSVKGFCAKKLKA